MINEPDPIIKHGDAVIFKEPTTSKYKGLIGNVIRKSPHLISVKFKDKKKPIIIIETLLEQANESKRYI